jgi:hypothetical protein
MTTTPVPAPTCGVQASSTLQFVVLAPAARAADGWRLVGRYPTYDDAVHACIDDVIAQLEANDGWLITCDHLIVGPGSGGDTGCWPHVSRLGADPGSDRVPAPYDRAAWRSWLVSTHGLDA